MQKRLFQIKDIIKDFETETITVIVQPNPYTGEIIMIDFTEFKVFLDKNDRLYYETHDCSTGQYVSKSHNMSIYQYLDEITSEYFVEDLYEYIHDHCINWKKAVDNVLFNTNTIINLLPKYLS